ncbi:MAG: binding domain, excisionase family protein [Clostridiaceae bacterium]|nr:binding domain, excisionase family protein [Clostridiaceae bacterium]
MEDYLLSVSEVAERLKTNRNFVYKLLDKGILKCLVMGSKKIRNSEINRFLSEYEGKDLTDLSNIKEVI